MTWLHGLWAEDPPVMAEDFPLSSVRFPSMEPEEGCALRCVCGPDSGQETRCWSIGPLLRFPPPNTKGNSRAQNCSGNMMVRASSQPRPNRHARARSARHPARLLLLLLLLLLRGNGTLKHPHVTLLLLSPLTLPRTPQTTERSQI
ncbi:hypothetical protein FQA47_008097 [Oryzias melastigma]|uniref:Uncharacterized protein n=1 Tax=Oryzias melastigma TaxID=30732 RepID=A0A834EZC2_ORYME|nr:hypothetical protein FQA47_008097 [Oryzias melastigma]